LVLFGKAISNGVEANLFQLQHPRALEQAQKNKKNKLNKKASKGTAATAKNKSVCFVSSYLHGGHQLVRIFDEVIRRLPHEGWKVGVAHVSKHPMAWRMLNQQQQDTTSSTTASSSRSSNNGGGGGVALFDETNKQYLVDEKVDIIPLPRFGFPCEMKKAYALPPLLTSPPRPGVDIKPLDPSVIGFMKRSVEAITSQDFNVVSV
jgi:hypothetical protein